MKNISELDDLVFDIKEGKYTELADSLEWWAEQFYEGVLEDAYSDCLAYLLYNMSKEMRKVEQ